MRTFNVIVLICMNKQVYNSHVNQFLSLSLKSGWVVICMLHLTCLVLTRNLRARRALPAHFVKTVVVATVLVLNRHSKAYNSSRTSVCILENMARDYQEVNYQVQTPFSEVT